MDNSVNGKVITLENNLVAISYYLYRQANCPYGDSLKGLMLWLDMQQIKLKELYRKEESV